jgi:hypothetical protein
MTDRTCDRTGGRRRGVTYTAAATVANPKRSGTLDLHAAIRSPAIHIGDSSLVVKVEPPHGLTDRILATGGHCLAIKTGAVRDFLDNSVVSYQTAEPKEELKAADIARNARAYTMLISCTATEKN